MPAMFGISPMGETRLAPAYCEITCWPIGPYALATCVPYARLSFIAPFAGDGIGAVPMALCQRVDLLVSRRDIEERGLKTLLAEFRNSDGDSHRGPVRTGHGDVL